MGGKHSRRCPAPLPPVPATAPLILGEAKQVEVFLLNGSSLTMEVDKTWSIRELKLAVEAALQVPYDEQLLQVDGESILSDDDVAKALNAEAPEILVLQVTPEMTAEDAYWERLVNNLVRAEELDHAPEEVRNNRRLMMTAVCRAGKALRYASDDLRADPDLALAAVRRDARAVVHVAHRFLGSHELATVVLSKCGTMLQHFPEPIRSDRAVVHLAVRNDGRALEFASEELKQDDEIVLAAIQSHGTSLKFAAEPLRANADMVVAAMRSSGLAFEYASEALRGDPDMASLAVDIHGSAFAHVSAELKADRELALRAIGRNPAMLGFACKTLQMDRAFVLEAMQLDPRAYFHAEYWRGRPDFALDAVHRYGDKMFRYGVFHFADREMFHDRSFVEALMSSPSLAYATNHREFSYRWLDKFTDDPDFMLAVLEQNAAAAKCAKYPLESNPQFWAAACARNRDVLPYVPRRLKDSVRESLLKQPATAATSDQCEAVSEDEEEVKTVPDVGSAAQASAMPFKVTKKKRQMEREKHRSQKTRSMQASPDEFG
eukprot:TRINITY_DN23459_c0_g1_i2.p1 TRINITY_DN23459_c0_g1~~TRINITY_DN23459_c0_g1_i2.p1  ORF type:complete len:547 (-),score=104.30 TRINITY_DN23459_c0_g1_i2:65-1705(-)